MTARSQCSAHSLEPWLLSGFMIALFVTGLMPATHAQTYTVLHVFTGTPDGASPNAALILDAAGNAYGTTVAGGANNLGTVFKVDTAGNETVLFSFAGGATGAAPYSALIRDAVGNLYGTASRAGQGAMPCGVVFTVDPTGKETVLYKFKGSPDGCSSFGGLTRDGGGNLYGTTSSGGTGSCSNGCGTVFKLAANGIESVLYSFSGGADGAYPFSGGLVFDAEGNLYGTTREGGSSNGGVVFKLDPTGKETVLYSFRSLPIGGLFRDKAGNLFGATTSGGAYGRGALFKVDAAGNESVLLSFPGGSDGFEPNGDLVRDNAGAFYGTTYGGTSPCVNPGDCGVIFKLDKTGQETVFHDFKGPTGAVPAAGLVRDGAGNLYGTTVNGGGLGKFGVVFRLIPPNFKLTVSPAAALVSPGHSVPSAVTITPIAGFTGTVATSCLVPASHGLSCEVSPSSVTLDGVNPETATLTIATSSTTTANSYMIKLDVISDTTHHCVTFALTVQ